MCGIYGAISFSGSDVPSGGLLRDLTDRMAHRGPDGFGQWERPGIALGHRRLAILDRRHGRQPWVDEARGLALVYNGELYNFRELREELAAAGHVFRTDCDTEVVLAAWAAWGPAAVERFDGMFAFGVVEAETRRVTLVRDRLGVKPLFFARHRTSAGEERLVFASEPGPILATPGVPQGTDPVALSHYLTTLQPSLGERSLHAGVQLVQAGTLWSFAPAGAASGNGPGRSGGGERRVYWDVPLLAPQDYVEPGEERAGEDFVAELRSAVRRRLVADTSVGAFLSGGIDSTVLHHLAAEESGGPLPAATVGFDDPRYSEVEFAREAAAVRGGELLEVVVDEASYFEEWEQAIARRGLPLSTPNEIPMLAMARACRDRFPVALTGEGADELLAGYGAIHRSPFDWLRAQALEHDAGRFSSDEKAAVENALRDVYGVTRFASPADHYLAPLQWIPLAEKQALWRGDFDQVAEGDRPMLAHYLELFAKVEHADPYDRLLYAHLKVNLAGLLMRVDGATMGAGLEARAPFTDHHLVEYCSTLPFHHKLRFRDAADEARAWGLSLPAIAGELDETKRILRSSFAGQIPEAIRQRPKRAFPVPITEWLAGPRRGWATERILGSVGLNDWFDPRVLEEVTRATDARAGFRMWPLVNLALWFEAKRGAALQAA